MGQFDSLLVAAKKAIKNAEALLESKDTPFNVMYKQYKTLQSFWLRVVEDAADFNSSKLEDLSVDLENMVIKCENWIKANSPTKNKAEGTEQSE